MPIKNVTLVGSGGSLGSVLLDALVGAGTFRVTVLKRAGSSNPTTDPADPEPADPDPEDPASAVRTVVVPDAWTEADLVPVLRGEDAVVASFRVADPPTAHLTLASAAAAAGVARFVPADFGSVDACSDRARELVPLFERKLVVQRHLQALAAATPSFGWTGLVCGHFFDWGLRRGFLHVYLSRSPRRIDILDRGEQRSSMSTLAQVGRALVAVLRRAEVEETRNRTLFVQSFCVTQNQLLEALEEATPGEKWDKRLVSCDDFVAKYVAKRDAGDENAIEELVFALGIIEGDWEQKEDFAMDLLGLEEENLVEVVRRVVAGG